MEKLIGIIHRLGDELSTLTAFTEGCHALIDAALEATGFDAGGVYLRLEERGAFRLVAHRGVSPRFVAEVFEFGEGAPPAVAGETDIPLFDPYIDHPVATALHESEGLLSSAVVPLRFRNRPVGLLTVASRRHRRFPKTAKTILRSIAAFAGSHFARLSAEAETRDREAVFTALADASPDAIIRLDGNGDVAYLNRGAERLFGFEPGEILGRRLHDLLPREGERDGFLRAFAGFRTEEEEAAGRLLEFVARRKDGRLFPVQLSVASVAAGGARHAIAILRDLTEIKRYEASLEAGNRDLAGKNAALTELLAHFERERGDLRRRLAANLNSRVRPLLLDLSARAESCETAALVRALSAALEELASPFGARLSALARRLISREERVASLIRAGLATKEIAEALGVSTRTVEVHRHRIRRKLGLRRSDGSLEAALRELSAEPA